MNSPTYMSGGVPRPSEFFRFAEDWAVRVCKYLRTLNRHETASATPRAMGDVVRLTKLIERLSRHGQTLSAVEAMDLAWRIENLLDLLEAGIDELLSPGHQIV